MENKIIYVGGKTLRDLTCSKCGNPIKKGRNFVLKIEACEGWEFEQNNGWDLFGIDFNVVKYYREEIHYIRDCKSLKIEYLDKNCGGHDSTWKRRAHGSFGSNQ